ncbi:MAG: hypothetical protein AAFO77_14780, partial [Pseudomonadota bacterium]
MLKLPIRASVVYPVLVAACGAIALSGCTSGSDVTFRQSSQPRVASWSCTADVRMTVRNPGSGLLLVSDTRGVETELPADPPGQRERYGKTGFALVFAGRTASWFVSG